MLSGDIGKKRFHKIRRTKAVPAQLFELESQSDLLAPDLTFQVMGYLPTQVALVDHKSVLRPSIDERPDLGVDSEQDLRPVRLHAEL